MLLRRDAGKVHHYDFDERAADVSKDIDAPYVLVVTVYLAVGWIALIELGALLAALSPMQAGLVVVGGVVYTVGAVVYALRRPDPWPKDRSLDFGRR